MSELARKDGRNIDPNLGLLSGEGSQQRVHDDVPARNSARDVYAYSMGDGATYYGRPVIKKSVWAWSIPVYYYVGGTTGASMVLGAAATILDRQGFSGLIRASRFIGAAGGALSSVLLIHDLGRPSRFLYMLRVFRVTSPMSVGSWILVSFSSVAGVAALAEFGPPGTSWIGDVATVAGGALGLGLAGYTGVLVAHTVVPLWQRPFRLLPLLFLSSAVAGSAALFDMLSGNERELKAFLAFGTAGRIAELAVAELVEKNVATVPEAARPFREGFSGFVWKAAKILTAVSLVLAVVAGSNRRARRVSGILGTLGALCTRFGIHHAGHASALNPKATFHQQRAGQGAFSVTGRAAITGPGNQRAFAQQSLVAPE